MRDEMDVGSGSTSPRPPSSDTRQSELATLIEAARHEATIEGRLAAVSLTLFPVVVATLLLAFDPNTAAALDGVVGWVILVIATALTAAGAWWLWRIAAPPFAAFPQRRSILERQPQTAYELSAILGAAADYADQGMQVADALERAAPADASHPSRALAIGLRALLDPSASPQPDGGDDLAEQERDEVGPADDRDDRPEDQDATTGDDDVPDEPDGSDGDGKVSRSAADEARSELPDWLISALRRGLTGDQPGWTDRDPVETLHLVATRIRAELEAAAYAWPGRVRIAALVPFAVCILPAAVLLALLAFL